VIARLIEVGGDIHGDGDVHELGILGWATAMGKCQRETADLLLRHGAEANIYAAVALEMTDRIRQVAADDRAQIHRRGSRFEHLRTPRILRLRAICRRWLNCCWNWARM
jgi:hypothetical protein